MASRLEVQSRRQGLYDFLKRACSDGTYAPGVMLPAVRELGEWHRLSNNVVFQVIQNLADEGVLYTVPRVGVFAGRPRSATPHPYLMVVPHFENGQETLWQQAQIGFEDRIAQLGGHSLILTHDDAISHWESDELREIAGVFEFLVPNEHDLPGSSGQPRVCFGDSALASTADSVRFDDVAGGVQATRHLQESGHQRIAFLGLHGSDTIGEFSWSAKRERGWRQALGQAPGNSSSHDSAQERDAALSQELLFLPRVAGGIGHDEQVASARKTAKRLVGREDISAVVAVNMMAATGMFEAFRDARWAQTLWPSVVCFDSLPGANTSVVSYMRLPWEEIGREAAQLLWERRTGRLTGKGVQRLVTMRLIPRLSCRPDWMTSLRLTARRVDEDVAASRVANRLARNADLAPVPSL